MLALGRPIAGMVYPRGRVQLAIGERGWQPLTTRTPVPEGSRLRTGAAGSALLLLAGDGLLGLGKDTEVEVGRRTRGELPVRLLAGELTACIPARTSLRLEVLGVVLRAAGAEARTAASSTTAGAVSTTRGGQQGASSSGTPAAAAVSPKPPRRNSMVGAEISLAGSSPARIRVDQGALVLERVGERVLVRAGEQVEVVATGSVRAVASVTRPRAAPDPPAACGVPALGALLPLAGPALGAAAGAGSGERAERELSRFRPRGPEP